MTFTPKYLKLLQKLVKKQKFRMAAHSLSSRLLQLEVTQLPIFTPYGSP